MRDENIEMKFKKLNLGKNCKIDEFEKFKEKSAENYLS